MARGLLGALLIVQATATDLIVRSNETRSIGNHTVIRARRILVHDGGILTIGTPEQPAENVTIVLGTPDTFCVPDFERSRDSSFFTTAEHACLEAGTLWSAGSVVVHGLPKTPWTVLETPLENGGSVIRVRRCDGWQNGDRIVVSPTGDTFARYVAAAEFDSAAVARTLRATIVASVPANCSFTLNATAQSRYAAGPVFRIRSSSRKPVRTCV